MDRVIIKPFGKDSFRLEYGYIYDDVVVPRGFVTNGADIPRIFWSFFPPNSPEYLSAVVVHDYLCAIASNKKDYERADKLFYKALKELGVNKVKSALFYICCRAYHSIKCFFC